MLNSLRNKIVLIALLLYSNSTLCQNWQSVGSLSDVAEDFFVDEETQLLHVAGLFKYADTMECRGLVHYNGTAFGKLNLVNNLNCYITNCGGTFSIIKYNNEFYAAGYYVYDTKYVWLIKYVNGEWVPCCNYNKNNGAVWSLKVVNNKFFALGGFDSLCDKKIKRIAVFENNTWNEFGQSNNLFGQPGNETIEAAEYYKGEYYFAGNFNIGNGMNDIVRWNGSQWNSLGNGVTGGLGAVKCLKVYKGLLYVGGYYFQSATNLRSFLMAWNGQQWIDPFPGIQFIDDVRDMEIINDKLYISGTFIIPSDNDSLSYQLSRYDGCKFGAFGIKLKYPKVAAVPIAIEGFQGKIYVSNPPDTLDNMVTTNLIAFNENAPDFRTINYSQCPVTPKSFDTTIFPNPFSNSITISGNYNNVTITIVNTLGQKVFETDINISSSYSIVTQGFSEGVYYLTVSDKNEKLIFKKIIKLN